MSTVASAPAVKQLLVDFITRSSQTLANDLSFIPEEKLNVCPMGCARSPLNFTAECAGFNLFVGGVFTGEIKERPSQEERERFYESLNTLEKATAMLKKSASDLVSSIEAADDDVLTSEVTAPWGAVVQLYQLAHAAGVHMMYHDGQVNYVQCLYGDEENHWAPPI